jgi:hypothetical protein
MTGQIMDKGFRSRYFLTSDRARSKETGNEGAIIMGWSLGLPDQAHKLVLSSSASQLVQQKKFFLPYERYIANDKLLADLRFSKTIGVIPVYFGSLPESEGIHLIASTKIQLPILSSAEAQQQKKEINRIKRKLSELLLTTKESVLSLLNDLSQEVDEMMDNNTNAKTINAQMYCLEFNSGLKSGIHFAVVLPELKPEKDDKGLERHGT